MWVFGYGSLLWKPDFRYEEQMIGYVRGYKRRFWLLNTDHRGIPEKPGRVVTLVHDPEHLVWGVAYKIPQDLIGEVKRKLAIREKDYEVAVLTVYPREGNKETVNAMMHICSPQHPLYGPTDEAIIAEDIKTSVGPSGRNAEYLFKLAEYVREYIPEDQDNHLFTLEHLVKQACA